MESIIKHKTLCCNADWFRKAPFDFRCKKCKSDVTMEVMLVHTHLERTLQRL